MDKMDMKIKLYDNVKYPDHSQYPVRTFPSSLSTATEFMVWDQSPRAVLSSMVATNPMGLSSS